MRPGHIHEADAVVSAIVRRLGPYIPGGNRGGVVWLMPPAAPAASRSSASGPP